MVVLKDNRAIHVHIVSSFPSKYFVDGKVGCSSYMLLSGQICHSAMHVTDQNCIIGHLDDGVCTIVIMHGHGV
jgi:hypothetical protein